MKSLYVACSSCLCRNITADQMVKNVRKKCCMKATICSREKKVFSGSGTKTNFLSELTHQDWKDVHLVGTEVVVQEVSLSSICHKKAVPWGERT